MIDVFVLTPDPDRLFIRQSIVLPTKLLFVRFNHMLVYPTSAALGLVGLKFSTL